MTTNRKIKQKARKLSQTQGIPYMEALKSFKSSLSETKNRKYFTPADMISNKSSNEDMLKYLGNLIHNGASFLVAGNTSAGKTSLLNCLSSLHKPGSKIVSIEEDFEITQNVNESLWFSLKTDGKHKSMSTLINSAMQSSADVIILGEVTEHSAYHFLYAMLTGHNGASTIHATNSKAAIQKMSSLVAQSELITNDAALTLVSAAVDIIVNVQYFPVDKTRRIVSIDEVTTEPTENNGETTLTVNPLFKFIEGGLDENNKITGHWECVGEISKDRINSKRLNSEKDKTLKQLLELNKI